MCLKAGFKDRKRINSADVVWEKVPKMRAHSAESAKPHHGSHVSRQCYEINREEDQLRFIEKFV